jgi:hypothetical protein
MVTREVKALAGLALLALIVSACAFGPPPSCGDTIGGTADTAAFDRYFSEMTLINETSGVPSPGDGEGAQFGSADPLALQVEAKSQVAVRTCIQPMSGSKTLAFDQTQTLAAGKGSLSLGTFKPGSYVIRVIVEGTLVRNFPFTTK